jgi:hypothetical protein
MWYGRRSTIHSNGAPTSNRYFRAVVVSWRDRRASDLGNASRRFEAENAALRHQLIVLRRKIPGGPWLTNNDRWFFVQMYRWFPSILKVVRIIQPETLVRWHRTGFHCYWRWKSLGRGGRPQIETELRALIRRMNIENPFWGAPLPVASANFCSRRVPDDYKSCRHGWPVGFTSPLTAAPLKQRGFVRMEPPPAAGPAALDWPGRQCYGRIGGAARPLADGFECE